MPDSVGRDAPFGETVARSGCPGHGEVQTLIDVGARHRLALAVRQQSRVFAQRWAAAQPGTAHLVQLVGDERQDAFRLA
jgi:hypothetical protein